MTTMSQGNKKIVTRKMPATNNKVLVRTGNLCDWYQYARQSDKYI